MMWWADRWRGACDTNMIQPNPEVDSGQSLASKGRVSVTQVEPGLVRASHQMTRETFICISENAQDLSFFLSPGVQKA